MDTEINHCFYFLKMLADEGYLGGRNVCAQTCIFFVCARARVCIKPPMWQLTSTQKFLKAFNSKKNLTL